MNNYHKTIDVPPDLHNKYIDKAVSQEVLILEFYRQSGSNGLTRFEVFELMKRYEEKPSNSSIGRAVSNLFRDNKILETGEKRVGEFGRDNTVYIFNPNPKEFTNKDIRIKLTEIELMLVKITIENYINSKQKDEPDVVEMLKNLYKRLPNME